MEVTQLVEQMTLMRIEMGVISNKIDNLNKLDEKLDIVSKIADHADQSVTSAHKRVDEVNEHYDKEITTLNEKIDNEINKLIATNRWIMSIAISAAAISISFAGLVYAIVK